MVLLALAVIAGLALWIAAFVWFIGLRSANDGPGDEARPLEVATVEVAGPPETVFDWSTSACEEIDIPDAPARAFRDAQGNVQLIASHHVNRRLTGPSLDQLRHPCGIVMASDLDADPSQFNDHEWIVAPYTPDGRALLALVHNEYQGDKHPGRCPSGEYQQCWYNTITLATSSDGGRTFADARNPPRHLVAAVPYRYQPDGGRTGIFQPSNILLREEDQYYYALVRAQQVGEQRAGTCVMRTGDLTNPESWRAWDGSGFNVRFVDPYRAQSASPGNHVCAPVSTREIEQMVQSVTFNDYLGKYLLVGVANLPGTPTAGTQGIFFSTSDDLIDWSPRRLIMETESLSTYECGDSDPMIHPSLLDPTSESRNFETTGRRPYLYVTEAHYGSDCRLTLDRDLIRIPLRISK